MVILFFIHTHTHTHTNTHTQIYIHTTYNIILCLATLVVAQALPLGSPLGFGFFCYVRFALIQARSLGALVWCVCMYFLVLI